MFTPHRRYPKQKYTDDERAEGDWFFALSEPARLRILRALAEGEQTTGELAKVCDVRRVNMSSHTRKLAAAGLITVTREGMYTRCALAKCATVTKAAIEFTHESGRKAVVPRA